MKTKALARVNAIFGLISGIVLLLAPLVMFMIAVGAAAATEDSDATVGILKDDERVTPAPSVLFIVGGSVGLIPFLGWVGGILTIIGGSLYFGLLKKFEIQE